ncbi:hypothetical protein SNE40_019492 [Patella caerulea]|uniref:Pleiotrophin/Midkine C-terminal domain-containing protein n=1 Tax=Patella caerulea TaxID=87958 RepID=A0AAN8P604_PATCE
MIKVGVISLILAITLIGCVLSDEILLRQERGARRQNRKLGCKYNKNPKVTACDPVTKTFNKTFTLKKGSEVCETTMVVTKPCNTGACRYRNNGPWSECDPATNMRTKTKILKKGGSTCEPTMTKTKPCKDETAKKRKNKQKKPCKYEKSDWNECDMTTNMRKRVLTLKNGDPNVCEAKKTVLKKCKKGKTGGMANQ